MEIIRSWVVDRSFEDDLPDSFPNSEKIQVCIIDFEYNDAPFWYIFFQSEEPMYPTQLRYCKNYVFNKEPMFFNLDDKIGLSDELSDFPPGWDVISNDAKEAVARCRDSEKKSLLDWDSFFTVAIILIGLGIMLFKLFYESSGIVAFLGVIACGLGLVLLWCAISYKKDYKNKCEKADLLYKARIDKIDSREYRDFTLQYCSTKKYSKEKRERGYWAYRKANPKPFSSCQNYYKL